MNIRLFELIKSLTPEEKRHFKLSAKYGTAKNYLKLFDALDKQEEYDEKAFQAKYKNEAWIKNLSATKKYLYELILKDLQNNHHHESVTIAVLGEIQKIAILHKKRLFEQAKFILEKALVFVEQHGIILLKPILMHWTLQLEGNGYGFEGQNLKWIFKQTNAYVDSSKNLLKFTRLHKCYAFFHYIKTYAAINRKKIKLITKKLSKIQSLAIQEQPYIELVRLNCMLAGFKILDNSKGAQQTLLTAVKIFEQYPFLKKIRQETYIVFLADTAYHLLLANELDAAAPFLKLLEQIDTSTQTSKYVIQLIGSALNWLKLHVYIRAKNYVLGFGMLAECENFILKHPNMPSSFVLLIQYFSGCMHFLNGNSEKALALWDDYYSKPLPTLKNFQTHAHLMRLIALYDSQPLLLPFAIGVSSRFLKKHKFYEDFERVWVLFFTKMVRLDYKLSRADWQNLHEDLVLVIASLEAQQAYSPLGFFPYLDWVEQQIQKS